MFRQWLGYSGPPSCCTSIFNHHYHVCVGHSVVYSQQNCCQWPYSNPQMCLFLIYIDFRGPGNHILCLTDTWCKQMLIKSVLSAFNICKMEHRGSECFPQSLKSQLSYHNTASRWIKKLSERTEKVLLRLKHFIGLILWHGSIAKCDICNPRWPGGCDLMPSSSLGCPCLGLDPQSFLFLIKIVWLSIECGITTSCIKLREWWNWLAWALDEGFLKPSAGVP